MTDNMIDTSSEQRQVASLEDLQRDADHPANQAEPLADWERELLAAAETKPETFGDWIITLNPGVVVRSGVHGNSFIWTGRYNNAGDEAILVSQTHGWHITVSRQEPLNDWEIQAHSDIMDQGMLRMAQHVAETVRQAERNTESGRRMLDSVAAERDTAQEKLAQIDTDFTLLNEKLNHYALQKGWCPEYESIQEQWNAEMQVLQLEGREWEWKVPSEVTISFSANLPITVRGNEDAAHDAVQSLSAQELLDLLIEQGISPRTSQVEMTGDAWRT